MGYDNGRYQSQLLHTKAGWVKTAMSTCSLPKIQDLAQTGEEEISRKSPSQEIWEILTSILYSREDPLKVEIIGVKGNDWL